MSATSHLPLYMYVDFNHNHVKVANKIIVLKISFASILGSIIISSLDAAAPSNAFINTGHGPEVPSLNE